MHGVIRFNGSDQMETSHIWLNLPIFRFAKKRPDFFTYYQTISSFQRFLEKVCLKLETMIKYCHQLSSIIIIKIYKLTNAF